MHVANTLLFGSAEALAKKRAKRSFLWQVEQYFESMM
jgi:hypothetical protein